MTVREVVPVLADRGVPVGEFQAQVAANAGLSLGLGILLLARQHEAQIAVARRYRAALTLIDKAPRADRAALEFRRSTPLIRKELGLILARLGKKEAAVKEYRTALAQLDSLIAELPSDRPLAHARAQTKLNLMYPLNALDRTAEAEASCQAALADYEQLAREPSDFLARQFVAHCHRALAAILTQGGNNADALKQLQAARDVWSRLVADSPSPVHRDELGLAISNIGHTLRELGSDAEAEKEHRAALEIFRTLVAEAREDRTYRRHLAFTLKDLGFLAVNQQRYAETEKLAVEADTYFADLYKTLSNDQLFRISYTANTGYLAIARAHAGEYREADQLLAKMVALDPNTALCYFNAACVLGHCVRAAERDTKLTDQKRKDLVNEYTDRALGYLRRALELGAVDRRGRHALAQIPADKDLDPFRNHPEFKRILAEIEKLPALAPPPREVKQSSP